MRNAWQPFLIVIGGGLILGGVVTPGEGGEPTAAEVRLQLERDTKSFGERLARYHSARGASTAAADRFADAEVFHRGLVWALRYDATFSKADLAILHKALARGRQRADDLAAGRQPWRDVRGRLVRGYVSTVDGSTQPFGLVVPAQYDSARPMRLDVVLHGSMQPVGLSELRFMSRFDAGDGKEQPAPQQDYLELHPLGRVENCYRWAGETDVFEAIEAVCRNYNVDRDRIVLRGMSMGASGAWHLGLKHPDRFVALGPYCGYVDTHEFSLTPIKTFIKVGQLPAHQEKALHLMDAVGYAANAGVVPAIACMGEKDVFFQSHVLMGRAMAKEGLKIINLISPGTGHVQDPATHKEQMRRIGAYAVKGLDHAPRNLRFVTWSLKYNRCHWLRILQLGEHYVRAEVEAGVAADGAMTIKEPLNVTRLAVLPPMLQGTRKLRVGQADIALPALAQGAAPAAVVIGRRDGKWTYLGDLDAAMPKGKSPGLQGPIDDAFTRPFLCVRGTGQAWNPKVQAWSDASLKRFAYEWHRYFRGDLPVKDDVAVCEDDVRRCNIILFGDPGSNVWIRKALPNLPLQWTRQLLQMGGTRYSAADHAPALIQPNPLPGGQGRYLVLNSGHTFHEKELASLNYLLFPRLGDWAILRIGDRLPAHPAAAVDEEVVRAGFCQEDWRIDDGGKR